MSGAPDSGNETHPGLVRAVSRWQIVGLSINDVIGSGIYLLPAATFLLLGPASIWAVLLAGLVVALLVLCYAQAASYFDQPGGSYLYAREAFGRFVGFEIGWMIWLTRIASAASLSNGLADAVSRFWAPASGGAGRAFVIVASLAFLPGINLVGVKSGARTGRPVAVPSRAATIDACTSSVERPTATVDHRPVRRRTDQVSGPSRRPRCSRSSTASMSPRRARMRSPDFTSPVRRSTETSRQRVRTTSRRASSRATSSVWNGCASARASATTSSAKVCRARGRRARKDMRRGGRCGRPAHCDGGNRAPRVARGSPVRFVTRRPPRTARAGT